MKLLAIITSFTSLLFLSCKNDNNSSFIKAAQAVQLDSLPGQCPYLTKDAKGNVVLSWVRTTNDSSSVFCYAVSKDGGKSFGKATLIPSSNNIEPHSENLPKIIFKPSGEIIALWGAANPNPKNKYSGLVFYAQSFDDGKTWSNPKTLVNDTASFDQRYYDVALLPNGEAGIIWLDNRKTTTKDGSALYFASTEGENGFQHDRLISQPCCQCCRTDLFVDNKGGIHALYRGIIQDSIRDMVHIVSNDGGKIFSSPQRISNDNWVISGCPHTGPAMTENKNGLHFAWFTGGKNAGCFYIKSTNNGNSFTMHDSISALGSHPQMTALQSGALVVVWDETTTANNKLNKKIGVQKRSDDGIAESKGFITPDGETATYPVVAAINENTSLIAYTQKKGSKNFITYQVVRL
ncbi:MAG: hypothetical protein ACTHOF_18255 [Flavisolibacter sp.]|jgi:hypothetical protein